MSAITCNVVKLDQVNDHVYHVELSCDTPFSFKAGQYLQVVMGDKDKRPFSIASSPEQAHLELHIGASVENSYAMEVIDRLKAQGRIDVEVGLGEAWLRQDSDRPILLLAGGTGFSYVQSIARHLAQVKPDHQVILYWGGKNRQSLYADAQMQQWQSEHDGFRYVPVVEHADSDWQGETGYVHQAVLHGLKNLQGYDIYMAGHFDMMKVVRDDFLAHGAEREHMYADAFAFI